MTRRRWIVRAACWVALGVIVIAAPAVEAQQVIKIAAGVPLTGALAKQGQEVANAVKLAAEEWNKKGGVLGMKIEVFEADDQGNPQIGVAAAEKVAADPAVMAAVWGITSVTCIPVSEVLDRVNIALISPGCTNPKVTDRGLKNVNRVCARDDAQGPAGAIFAVQDLKAKKIAIFDDGTTGPKGAADEVEKKAKEAKARISDSWVTAKTKIALFADDRVKGRKVNVDTNNGVVTLRGTVDSSEAKSVAEEIARGVKGVKSVQNNLEVVAPSPQKAAEANDKDINRQVARRLLEDPRLKKVDVRTDAGVVTLKGEVPTITDSARASQIAREVPGVRAVKNELNTSRESSMKR